MKNTWFRVKIINLHIYNTQMHMSVKFEVPNINVSDVIDIKWLNYVMVV